MKKINKTLLVTIITLFLVSSCHNLLNEPVEDTRLTENVDYSVSGDMIKPLLGAYQAFYSRHWVEHLMLGTRGDDVSAGGDQPQLQDENKYVYVQGWMLNEIWFQFYQDIFSVLKAMEQIKLYQENGGSETLSNQYIAECKVLNAFMLFQLNRFFKSVLIPTTSNVIDLVDKPLLSKNDVFQYLVDQMNEAIPFLPDLHPSQRTDVKGGVTKYTALAIKAMSLLELKQWNNVTEATAEIINSNRFSLFPDYYNLFKIGGELSSENIFEMQYSDFNQGTGDRFGYLYAPYGRDWRPRAEGVNGGWGFYSPTIKYIEFMLARSETVRLETSVLFSPSGIDEIKKNPTYSTLPNFISNTTRNGDEMRDTARVWFSSGKHYLPSEQVTTGRTDYSSGKNFICIRYAEILLIHAEAVAMGGTPRGKTALDAVNEVRQRASMPVLTSVNLDVIIDEKFAELACEWGNRFYDLIRHQKYSELTYLSEQNTSRVQVTFTEDKTNVPFPVQQTDRLPQLR